jgi:hypothetical protein
MVVIAIATCVTATVRAATANAIVIVMIKRPFGNVETSCTSFFVTDWSPSSELCHLDTSAHLQGIWVMIPASECRVPLGCRFGHRRHLVVDSAQLRQCAMSAPERCRQTALVPVYKYTFT